MNAKEAIERIEKHTEAIRAAEKAMFAEAETILRAVAQPLFDAGIKLIKWTQYTPYFNDGEPCVFGVSELEFYVDKSSSFAEMDAEDEDDEPEDLDYLNYNSRYEEPWKDIIETFECAHGLLSDFFESEYGDGVTVEMMPDGTFLTSEYDHD